MDPPDPGRFASLTLLPDIGVKVSAENAKELQAAAEDIVADLASAMAGGTDQ